MNMVSPPIPSASPFDESAYAPLSFHLMHRSLMVFVGFGLKCAMYLGMYMYVCIYVYIYIHAYVCTYVCIHVCMYE